MKPRLKPRRLAEVWSPGFSQRWGRRIDGDEVNLLASCRVTPAEAGTPNRGFVLVAVLVIILLASMVAVSLLFRLKAEDTATNAAAGAEQAWAAAMSGVHEAIRVAAAVKPGFTEWRNQPRSFRSHFVCDDGAEHWYFTVYSPPDDDALAELRFGLTDEAAKLNVNTGLVTNMTGCFPNVTVQHIAALRDFVDRDDIISPEGAEQEYYSALAQPYLVHNRPLDTLDELLLIRGFTPALLYGEDANMNWRLDPNENDGDELLPTDNNDGRLDMGLQPLLTVSSYDPNEDNDGAPRTNVNDPKDELPGVELPAGLTNFLAAARTNNFKIGHAADLLEAKLKIKDSAGKETEIASGIGKNELPLVLDLFTGTHEEHFDGLINVNTASIAVLTTVPGIDEPLAESILSTRRSISPERRATIAWLYQEAVVDAALFKRIAPFLTARSYQYSFRVVGFGLTSGRFRVLDVVIDVAPDEPGITYMRDITRLGAPFKFEATEPTQVSVRSKPVRQSLTFARALPPLPKGEGNTAPAPALRPTVNAKGRHG
jgi:hypothetical protein